MKVTIEIEKDTANVLNENLKNPDKDSYGRVGYFVSLELAREVREALSTVVK